MTRETVYSGGPEGEAYHVEDRDDGAVILMRTTDVDDGPARTICISRKARLRVALGLIGNKTYGWLTRP